MKSIISISTISRFPLYVVLVTSVKPYVVSRRVQLSFAPRVKLEPEMLLKREYILKKFLITPDRK